MLDVLERVLCILVTAVGCHVLTQTTQKPKDSVAIGTLEAIVIILVASGVICCEVVVGECPVLDVCARAAAFTAAAFQVNDHGGEFGEIAITPQAFLVARQMGALML
jgi:hypothetical protein